MAPRACCAGVFAARVHNHSAQRFPHKTLCAAGAAASRQWQGEATESPTRLHIDGANPPSLGRHEGVVLGGADAAAITLWHCHHRWPRSAWHELPLSGLPGMPSALPSAPPRAAVPQRRCSRGSVQSAMLIVVACMVAYSTVMTDTNTVVTSASPSRSRMHPTAASSAVLERRRQRDGDGAGQAQLAPAPPHAAPDSASPLHGQALRGSEMLPIPPAVHADGLDAGGALGRRGVGGANGGRQAERPTSAESRAIPLPAITIESKPTEDAAEDSASVDASTRESALDETPHRSTGSAASASASSDGLATVTRQAAPCAASDLAGGSASLDGTTEGARSGVHPPPAEPRINVEALAAALPSTVAQCAHLPPQDAAGRFRLQTAQLLECRKPSGGSSSAVVDVLLRSPTPPVEATNATMAALANASSAWAAAGMPPPPPPLIDADAHGAFTAFAHVIRCKERRQCPTWVGTTVAYHLASILGLHDHMPPTIARYVDATWVIEHCRSGKLKPSIQYVEEPLPHGGGHVRSEKKSRTNSYFATRGLVVTVTNKMASALQVKWEGVYGQSKPPPHHKPHQGWVEAVNSYAAPEAAAQRAAARGSSGEGDAPDPAVLARVWGQWSDLVLFDFLLGQVDRSRAFALDTNLFWRGPVTVAVPRAPGGKPIAPDPEYDPHTVYPLVFLDNDLTMAQIADEVARDPSRLWGLCRFRRATVDRLRAAVDVGELLHSALRACERVPNETVLYATSAEQDAELYAQMSARRQIALDHIARCVAELGGDEDLVLSLP